MIFTLGISLPLLGALLQDPDPATLLKRLHHKDATIRIQACEAVTRSPVTDPRVIEAVLSVSDAPTPPASVFDSVGYHASAALVACGPAAVPVLIAGLGDRQHRDRAAGALGVIRPIDERTLPALRKCLDKNKADAAGSCSVVIAIGALGADGKDAIPELQALLTTKRLRNATLAGGTEGLFYGDVIESLGMIGPDAAPVIPDLLELAATERGLNAPVVRRLSVKALGKIGFGPSDNEPETRSAILDALRRCRNDADPSVVAEADTASALLDPEYHATVDARKDGLRHRDGQVRAQTCILLGSMGQAARSATAELARMATDDPDEAVREAAAAALKQIDG